METRQPNILTLLYKLRPYDLENIEDYRIRLIENYLLVANEAVEISKRYARVKYWQIGKMQELADKWESHNDEFGKEFSSFINEFIMNIKSGNHYKYANRA